MRSSGGNSLTPSPSPRERGVIRLEGVIGEHECVVFKRGVEH